MKKKDVSKILHFPWINKKKSSYVPIRTRSPTLQDRSLYLKKIRIFAKILGNLSTQALSSIESRKIIGKINITLKW